MKDRARHVLLMFLVTALTLPALADEMRIVAPYAGSLTNTTDVPNAGEITDSGLLTGLFFQWIDTERYQWNLFAYWAPDVNYSSTLGGHFIYDRFFGPGWHGGFVAGLGLEALRVDLDAGSALGTDDLDMETTVFVPFLRAGKYFKASLGSAAFSLLPWIGIQPQWVWGELVVDLPIPGPGPIITTSLDDFTLFGIAGINLKLTLFHFIDLEGKYQATFDDSEYFNSFNAMANLYFSRNWGLSYRFKHMESSQGTNAYHYLGLAFIF